MIICQMKKTDHAFKEFPMKDALAQNIANKIIGLREYYGLSTYALSRKSKVTRATISQIESGEHLPSLTVLDRIAKAFHLSVNDLLIESTESEEKKFFIEFGDIRHLNEEDKLAIKYIMRRFLNRE